MTEIRGKAKKKTTFSRQVFFLPASLFKSVFSLVAYGSVSVLSEKKNTDNFSLVGL